MATVPIVTEVTKAELDALVAANGLNEGLQYKVTDKDWLLMANSSNTLLPVDQIILYANEQGRCGVPSYLICNRYITMLDVTRDISSETGDPLFINFVDEDGNSLADYFLEKIIFYTDELTSSISNILITFDGNTIVENQGLSPNDNSVLYISGMFQVSLSALF